MLSGNRKSPAKARFVRDRGINHRVLIRCRLRRRVQAGRCPAVQIGFDYWKHQLRVTIQSFMTGVHADETMGMIGIVATISACGTFKTLNDEKGAADDLARWQSNCYSIPRASSCESYQFCNLNAPPHSGPHWDALTIASDLALSGIADTLSLPYMGYLQYRHGDINVRRKQY